jgi:acyl-CoA reductase-like NAD-dependent aldehyde dehydrogenase
MLALVIPTSESLNYINGKWVPARSGATFPNCDPSTGEVIGEFPKSDEHDLQLAVEAAKATLPRWRKHPAPRRAEILFRVGEEMVRRKEELSRALTVEMGKTLEDARGDVQESIDLAYYFAGEGRRLFGVTTPSESPEKQIFSVRVPVGVVGAISPFNFPFAIPALKSLPALIAGNTMVLKPAQDTPHLANLLAQVYESAGLPAGAFNVVHGSGAVLGRCLTEHPDVSLLSFTGSKDVGIEITQRSAGGLKKTILELGGKNCIIVMDDAILDEAVRGILWSAFGTAGQRCTAASRIIAHRGIHDELVHKMQVATRDLTLGSGLDDATDIGPLINAAAVERVRKYIDIGVQEGAEVVVGGGEQQGPGHFFEPTLFVGARPDMRIAQEEIFGPVTAVIPADDLQDAITIANGIEYGLSAAIYTENIAAALTAADGVEVGLFYVNAGTIGAEAHLPTGGMKASGNGHREASIAAIDSYSEWRSVYIDYSHRLQRAQIDIDIPI